MTSEQEALTAIMRTAEAAKEPCGSDPESPTAIRNSKFATIAMMAAQGLGIVRGPSLAGSAQPEEPVAWQLSLSFPAEGDYEWSPWREVDEDALRVYRRKAAEHPDRFRLRPVYTHPVGAVLPAPDAPVSGLESVPRDDGWRHVANEWADCACNAVQWLRNIRNGISTAEDALKNLGECMRGSPRSSSTRRNTRR